jgi:hypothetical protein
MLEESVSVHKDRNIFYLVLRHLTCLDLQDWNIPSLMSSRSSLPESSDRMLYVRIPKSVAKYVYTTENKVSDII